MTKPGPSSTSAAGTMMAHELPLSPAVFAIFAGLLEEKSGLSYVLNDRELLATKISVRAVECGYDSALDYYYHLRYDDDDGAELAALIESLLVHETYFFRELDQLEMIVRSILVPAAVASSSSGRRPRVWSAACSTGEEPLTLAMMLDDAGVLDKVDIVASDVSARVVGAAQAGRFGRRAVRSTAPPALCARYLTSTDDGYAIERRLVDKIDWRVVNLLDDAAVSALGDFDVVLCRNTLFYFKDDVAQRVAFRLAARLRDDGSLFVGVAESLSRFGGPLVCEERGGVFVYKKKPGAPAAGTLGRSAR